MTTKTRTEERRKEEETILSDELDLFTLATKVHSDIAGMNRDYTLANYESNIMQSKIPKFIREQRKVLRIIKSYIVVPIEKLQKKYGKEEAQKVLDQLETRYERIEKLIIGELDEIVIMSRAEGGKVRNSILSHGLIGTNTTEINEAINGENKETLTTKATKERK